jgi:hypothetical protein
MDTNFEQKEMEGTKSKKRSLTLALSQRERENALSFCLVKAHVCNTERRRNMEKRQPLKQSCFSLSLACETQAGPAGGTPALHPPSTLAAACGTPTLGRMKD